MKKRIKINKTIIFCLFIFYLISILSISSTLNYLPETLNNLVIKQTIFYILGIILIFIMINIDLNILINKAKYIYLLNVFLLLLVLRLLRITFFLKSFLHMFRLDLLNIVLTNLLYLNLIQINSYCL